MSTFVTTDIILGLGSEVGLYLGYIQDSVNPYGVGAKLRLCIDSYEPIFINKKVKKVKSNILRFFSQQRKNHAVENLHLDMFRIEYTWQAKEGHITY